jgi:hypothetical protein
LEKEGVLRMFSYVDISVCTLESEADGRLLLRRMLV